ncbi:allantoate amidohydrolase [Paenibacillus sp. CCS19]|uniref:allantoate deiminase n=1 Tax=Paenibacillus sp. CCS19 TaxID=3158387 RepID=UPI0025665B71|nr:allantoate deiminase [Paenibacillus cellulosilyticus]GMK38840.1 allantoate amidohydrolase [Paenibacillus cellulosilyticus]
MRPPLDMSAFAELPGLLDELAGFGAEEGGGVTRLLYTESWRAAQLFLEERMRVAGLETRFDRAGNLYGRLLGADSAAPVVLTGSHVDTVRSGGRYDGSYGVVAGLMALAALKRTCGAPLRTLEVVSLCEEEGSRFPLAYWGSGNATGVYGFDDGEGIADADGITLAEAMRTAGFGLETQTPCLRRDIGAFVELHIEQGIVLERSGRQIGLVEAIVGQRRYAVTLTGASNHAGTTPMSMRADALAGAVEMLALLETRAKAAGDPLVATVGRLETMPGTPNVIPGEVRFTLDIRHDKELKLESFCRDTLAAFEAIARSRGLGFESRCWLATKPTQMDDGLTGLLERACLARANSSRRMVSGAGHDAQLFAAVCPAAMLFVPSRGGVSHSSDEYSTPEQLTEGAAVLADCLYELAYGQEWRR